MDREPNAGFRVAGKTRNPEVKIYRFGNRHVDIPSNPEDKDWAGKMLRFAELHEFTQKTRKAGREHELPMHEISAEKESLGRELTPYLQESLRNHRKSVLKNSWHIPDSPDASGKDSHVYYTGTKEEFLARPDTPRYVSKYSVPSREANTENIEYLKKKYRILKKLLGKHIPRAGFILGEFRKGIPKYELGVFDVRLRAITVQREIRGKTFAEMSLAERSSPPVVQSLMEALRAYCIAQDTLHDTCIEAGLKPKTFELSLDIGDLNCDGLETHFDPTTYSSPNVMYDERKNCVFFIDMGWGSWSAKQEKVYRKIMQK